MSFESLQLRAELVAAVSELGYDAPTPIQMQAIPPLLQGKDVIGQAQTGTGKTAAFGLPMLSALQAADTAVQGLVLVPTRELAMQVSNALFRYGQCLGIHVLAIYGGQAYSRQRHLLQRGAQIVVGTPGRTLDLIRQGVLHLDGVKFLVLDEADEMLRMGFIEEVEAILQNLPPHQTALFSATFSGGVRGLAERYLKSPLRIEVEEKTLTVSQTLQRYYLVEPRSRTALLVRLLELEGVASALIFVRTKVGAAELASNLQARGIAAEALHGDLSQEAREAALSRFRRGHTTRLVATDVAARGLDIPDVSHVINYDMADKPEEYLHRVGRTGRAGRSGVAISLVTPAERGRVAMISNYTRQPMQRVPVPTVAEVEACREVRFQARVEECLSRDLTAETAWVQQRLAAGSDSATLAAALLRMARGEEAALPQEEVSEVFDKRPRRAESAGPDRFDKGSRRAARSEGNMVVLSFELGRKHGIKPRDVVGAITHETGVPAPSIGAIEVGKHRTLVNVAEPFVTRVLRRMSQGSLRGHAVQMVRE